MHQDPVLCESAVPNIVASQAAWCMLVGGGPPAARGPVPSDALFARGREADSALATALWCCSRHYTYAETLVDIL